MSATRGLIMLLLAGAATLTWPARAKQDGEFFQDRVITVGGTEYHFRVFTPKGWSKKKQSPVILFLHGAGERGDGAGLRFDRPKALRDNFIRTQERMSLSLIRRCFHDVLRFNARSRR